MHCKGICKKEEERTRKWLAVHNFFILTASVSCKLGRVNGSLFLVRRCIE